MKTREKQKQTEELFLDAIMQKPSIYYSAGITEQHFTGYRKAIWKAIENLITSGKVRETVDLGLLRVELGIGTETEFYKRLSGIIGAGSVKDWQGYAKTLRQYKRIDDIGNIARQLTEIYKKGEIDEDLINVLVDRMTIGADTERHDVSIQAVFERYLTTALDPNRPDGLYTGFYGIDRITHGLRNETLIIAGETGIGKSMLADQIGLQFARAGHTGIIYSLEIPEELIVSRWLSSVSGLTTIELETLHKLDEKNMQKISKAISQFEKLPLYIDDYKGWTIPTLRADIARRVTNDGIKWFILDYIGKMNDRPELRNFERLEYIVRELVKIRERLGIVGILIASLVKGTTGAVLDSVSGGKGQVYDADTVLMLREDKNEMGKIHGEFIKGRKIIRTNGMRFTIYRKSNRPVFYENN